MHDDPPLKDRIRAICAEVDALIDTRVAEDHRAYPGIPLPVLRSLITTRNSGCQCRQYLRLMDQG